jgi:hypothetical protein
MSTKTILNDVLFKAERPMWSAVFAMALCVAVLIASEFMPVSLLSPIAHDLGLTKGQAGQAIAVSGIFAMSLMRITPLGKSVYCQHVHLFPSLSVHLQKQEPPNLRIFASKSPENSLAEIGIKKPGKLLTGVKLPFPWQAKLGLGFRSQA